MSEPGEVKDNVNDNYAHNETFASKKTIGTLSNHLFKKQYVEMRYFQLLCLQCPIHHQYVLYNHSVLVRLILDQ